MRLLLDSHALIWWMIDEPIAEPAIEAIADPTHTVMVSPASVWEIGIKVKLGKLRVEVPMAAAVRRLFTELAVTLEHGEAAAALPLHHRDPFDRLLIAQAMVEDLTIVTRDAMFARYDVKVLAC